MPSDVVRVVYTKYDGSRHRDYPARRLAEDDLGTWLGVHARHGIGLPRPAVGRADPVRPAGPALRLVDRDVQPAAADQRGLLRHRHPGPVGRATTRCTSSTSISTWCAGGTPGWCELRDEDEFAEHRDRFGYPDDVVTEARGRGRRG